VERAPPFIHLLNPPLLPQKKEPSLTGGTPKEGCQYFLQAVKDFSLQAESRALKAPPDFSSFIE
jgi:hypothetical protein